MPAPAVDVRRRAKAAPRNPKWASDKNMDPYTTTRKVYAVGARSAEFRVKPGPTREHKLKEPANSRTRQRTKTFQALPFGRARGWAPLSLDANDLETQKLGLNRRLCRQCEQPRPGFYHRFQEFVQKWCERHLTPLSGVPEFEAWISASPYPESRRAELRLEWERLKGAPPTLRQSSKIASFIKRESYQEQKAPRWINSRVDAFKAWSGRYFSAIEKVVFDLPYFIKHVPVPDRAARIESLRKVGLYYYENDYKAFEASLLSPLMRACECVLYRHMLKRVDPAAGKYIQRVLTGKNRLHTRAGLRCVIEGGRMSGDMCTSLGNGFTNLMLVMFIVHEKMGTYEGLGALVEGDDGLFASPCRLSAADFAGCGFTAEIKELDDPMDGHFVGMVMSRDGTILKDPHKVLSNFGWTASYIGHGEATGMELLRAKALSLAYELPQCPIAGALARAAMRFTEGYQPRWTDTWRVQLDNDIRVGEFTPTEQARVRFAELFGISPASQREMEAMIEQGRLNDLILVTSPPRDVEAYSARYLEVAG